MTTQIVFSLFVIGAVLSPKKSIFSAPQMKHFNDPFGTLGLCTSSFFWKYILLAACLSECTILTSTGVTAVFVRELNSVHSLANRPSDITHLGG